MEKAVITINSKEYELKFTIGFWKRAKEFNVDSRNIEQRLQEDFGTVATQIIEASIVGIDRPSVADIESSLDRSVIDVFEQAIINGMTKAEREVYDLAKKRRDAAIKGLEAEPEKEGSDEKK